MSDECCCLRLLYRCRQSLRWSDRRSIDTAQLDTVEELSSAVKRLVCVPKKKKKKKQSDASDGTRVRVNVRVSPVMERGLDLFSALHYYPSHSFALLPTMALVNALPRFLQYEVLASS